jgi:hypothetical protein
MMREEEEEEEEEETTRTRPSGTHSPFSSAVRCVWRNPGKPEVAVRV